MTVSYFILFAFFLFLFSFILLTMLWLTFFFFSFRLHFFFFYWRLCWLLVHVVTTTWQWKFCENKLLFPTTLLLNLLSLFSSLFLSLSLVFYLRCFLCCSIIVLKIIVGVFNGCLSIKFVSPLAVLSLKLKISFKHAINFCYPSA